MKLTKIIQFLFLVTFLALIYIHMQMQIFNLAYQGKFKERQIIDLKENNGMISYNISRLKSANHLGMKLLSEKSDLHFLDQNSVVQIVTAEPLENVQTSVPKINQGKTNSVLSFLSLKSQAEARTAEKKNSLKPWLHGR